MTAITEPMATVEIPDNTPAPKVAGMDTRFNRQLDFIPWGSLEREDIVVIGVGAIGRQVALQLAAVGVRKLTICDFDTVSQTNVTTQGFLHDDIGKQKVEATEEAIHRIDPEIEVVCVDDKFRPEHKFRGIVFVAVDKIEARKRIFETIGTKADVIIDGRMMGETWRVISYDNIEGRDHYEKTLFPQREQAEGRCTGHATIYSAAMPAAWMVHQLTKHLRGIPVDRDVCCNMFATEFFEMV